MSQSFPKSVTRLGLNLSGLQACKILLSQCFIQSDGDRVGQVEAAAGGLHGYTQDPIATRDLQHPGRQTTTFRTE